MQNKKIKYLVVAIPFFFNKKKIINLANICEEYLSFSKKVKVFIITNEKNKTKQKKIKNLFNKKINLKIISPNYLGHPFFLTWIHIEIFRSQFRNKNISHFLYTEDDIKITKKNIDYWLKFRPLTKKYRLIPSFLRYEINKTNKLKYSVDVLKKEWLFKLPKVKFSKKEMFVNLKYPYQGMYFLDRQLMKEHLQGLSSHPDFFIDQWNIRERAAQGVTFNNVPHGFTSRNVLVYNFLNQTINEDCLIHHTSNSYIKKKDIFCKFKVNNIIKKIL